VLDGQPQIINPSSNYVLLLNMDHLANEILCYKRLDLTCDFVRLSIIKILCMEQEEKYTLTIIQHVEKWATNELLVGNHTN
jgi:hypothetical protein